jgi:glc operon protein GlcG
VQGGLPIIIDGQCLGSIGVSGVASHEDEQVAMAAIMAVFPAAKMVRPGD